MTGASPTLALDAERRATFDQLRAGNAAGRVKGRHFAQNNSNFLDQPIPRISNISNCKNETFHAKRCAH